MIAFQVDRSAIDEEVGRDIALLGIRSIAEMTADLARRVGRELP